METTDTAHALAGYVDERTLAGELRISLRTLRRWHALRTGPRRTRIGGKSIYYYRRDVAAWIELQREDTAQRGAA